jgi:hypothetical protein
MNRELHLELLSTKVRKMKEVLPFIMRKMQELLPIIQDCCQPRHIKELLPTWRHIQELLSVKEANPGAAANQKNKSYSCFKSVR